MPDLIDEISQRRRVAASLLSPQLARAVRLSAGVTQERLATELKVHRVTVARWEAGASVPSKRHAEQYMSLLRELGRGQLQGQHG